MSRKGNKAYGKRWDLTEDFAHYMLHAFSEQNRGLAEFCDSDDEWPSGPTVWRWQADYEWFRELVVLYREMQMERVMHGTLAELIDCDPLSGTQPGDGAALVSKHRAAAEISQRLAAKMVPRVFNDRMVVDLAGNVSGKVQVTIDGDDVEEIDETAVIETK